MTIMIISNNSENILGRSMDSASSFDCIKAVLGHPLPDLKPCFLIVNYRFPVRMPPFSIKFIALINCFLDLWHVLRLIPVH